MKTIFLHIGQHKTGSTSIQNFCRRNKRVLNTMGYGYPGNGNQHDFCQAVLKEDTPEIVSYLGKIEYRRFEKYIISSESFCKCTPQNLENFAKVLKRRGWNVRVIVYLRRQDKAIESIYTQMLKNGKIKISINDYIRKSDFRNLHYGKFLDGWSEIFGKENIKILLFDKVKLGLLKSFLRSIGIKARKRHDRFIFVKGKKNAKPTAEEFQKLLEVNNFETNIYKKINEKSKRVSYSLISPQDSEYILRQFEKENKYVAKNYFNAASLF